MFIILTVDQLHDSKKRYQWEGVYILNHHSWLILFLFLETENPDDVQLKDVLSFLLDVKIRPLKDFTQRAQFISHQTHSFQVLQLVHCICVSWLNIMNPFNNSINLWYMELRTMVGLVICNHIVSISEVILTNF